MVPKGTERFLMRRRACLIYCTFIVSKKIKTKKSKFHRTINVLKPASDQDYFFLGFCNKHMPLYIFVLKDHNLCFFHISYIGQNNGGSRHFPRKYPLSPLYAKIRASHCSYIYCIFKISPPKRPINPIENVTNWQIMPLYRWEKNI
jgi:hypothetical protein